MKPSNESLTNKLIAWLFIAIAILLSCCINVQAGVTYYVNDLTGSPIAAMGESGQVTWRENFKPYGDRMLNQANAADNKVWFAARHQDADTGLIYMGARYYDPKIGRFLSTDAVRFSEGNVHSFNRYAYANNNPYRFKDPDGHNAVTAFGGLLTESYSFATGNGFDGSTVLGALKDGYNGEGAGFWHSAVEDVLSFGGGALGAAAKAALAARAARSATQGPVIIGETMARVEAEAAKHSGAKILNDMPDFKAMGMNADQVTSAMMQYNRKWILEQLRSGRQIIDLGVDANRAASSIFYQMEQSMLKNFQRLHSEFKGAVSP